MSPNEAAAPQLRKRLLRLNVTQNAVFTAVVTAGFATLWSLLVPALEARLAFDTGQAARRLATSLELVVATAEPTLVAEQTAGFRADPDFAGIVVEAADGTTLYAEPAALSDALRDATRRFGTKEVVEANRRFTAWAPIEVEGVPLGRVVVAYSLARIDVLHLWMAGFAALLALSFVTNVAFGVRFDQRFVAPFRSMGGFADQIARGRFDLRLEEARGVAESDDLVRALNRMARELGEQRSALVEAREEAERASSAKTRFLANMSHEIRTPLNGIVGIADVGIAESDAPEEQRDLQLIRSSALGLLAIIEDILDVAKIEAERVDVESLDTDLEAVLDHVLSATVSSIRKKGLDLEVAVEPEVPQWVVTDPTRLRQILMNLLSNAVKFTAEGGIRVGVQIQQGHLRFTVADDGLGMSAEQLDIVFEAFRQADASTTRRFGGTGLGLAISKSLSRLLGGDLTVESRPGVGSTFMLEIPWVAADRAAPARPGTVHVLGAAERDGAEVARVQERLRRCGAVVGDREAADVVVVCVVAPETCVALPGDLAARAAAGRPTVALCPPDRVDEVWGAGPTLFTQVVPTPSFEARLLDPNRRGAVARVRVASRALRVLLVEDDRVNQTVATRMLERLGHRVALAEDGRAGVDRVLESPSEFDLILMDMHMPVMDGLEATRCIRAAKCAIPIVALTADAMRGTEQICREAGMDHYLTKPIQLRDLGQVLTQYANRATADLEEHRRAG